MSSILVTNHRCEKKSIVLLLCKDKQILDRLRKRVNAKFVGGIPSSLNKRYKYSGPIVSIRSNSVLEYLKEYSEELDIEVKTVYPLVEAI